MMFDRKTQPLIHSLGDTHLTVIHRQKVNPPPLQPTLFMKVRREIAQSPNEAGARSHEAG